MVCAVSRELKISCKQAVGNDRRALPGNTFVVESERAEARAMLLARVSDDVYQVPIRQIWESRPRWWESGCCLGRRMSEAEKAFVGLTAVS